MRKLLLTALLLCAWMATASAAPQATETPDNTTIEKPLADNGNGERYHRNLERWRKMTPEQHERLRERHERWKKMSEEERARILENYRRLKKMGPERQQAVIRARRVMAKLEPKTREELHEHMMRMRRMPPERRHEMMRQVNQVRQVLAEDYEQLRELPPHTPEARQMVMQLRHKGRWLRRLDPETIERLRNLPPEERREELQKLMEKIQQAKANKMLLVEKQMEEKIKGILETKSW